MQHSQDLSHLLDMIHEMRSEIFGDGDSVGLKTQMQLLKQDATHRLALLEELRNGQRRVEKVIFSCGGALAVIEFMVHWIK